MKKIITSFVLLVALFIGFSKANALSLTSGSCIGSGTGNQTCEIKVGLADGETFDKNQKITIVLSNFRGITDNRMQITLPANWRINGDNDTSTGTFTYSIDSEIGVLEFEYLGDTSISDSEFVLFTATYAKDQTAAECGFNYNLISACYVDKTGTTPIYYGLDGNKTTVEKWTSDCTCKVLTTRSNGVLVNHYLGKDGSEITTGTDDEKLLELNKQCYSCTVPDKDGNYYYEGKILTSEEFKKYCETTCRIITNEDGSKTYYNDENKEVTKEEYEKDCGCRIVDGKDGSKTYIGPDNTVITKEEYENKCQPNTKTGAGNPYIFIAIGTLAAAASFVIIKRSNKLKNV